MCVWLESKLLIGLCVMVLIKKTKDTQSNECTWALEQKNFAETYDLLMPAIHIAILYV